MKTSPDHCAIQADVTKRRLDEDDTRSVPAGSVPGGIDGCLTASAVVAGSVGGEFSGVVIVVLVRSNLFADGFSMAASNCLGTKSEHGQLEKSRSTEEGHTGKVPQEEQEETRQVFSRNGFEVENLDGRRADQDATGNAISSNHTKHYWPRLPGWPPVSARSRRPIGTTPSRSRPCGPDCCNPVMTAFRRSCSVWGLLAMEPPPTPRRTLEDEGRPRRGTEATPATKTPSASPKHHG